MLRILVLLLVTTFGNSSAFAHADKGNPFVDVGCNDILNEEPIPRTAQPLYAIELESAGDIYTDRLPPLKTGFYIFLITSAGEILLADKYDVQQFMETGKGLATHKSLLRMYEEKTGTSAALKIVGGGEFQIAFGPVTDFSNRAGNFKSDRNRMLMASSYLKNKGLPINSFSRLRAIDPLKPEDRGHTPEDRNFDEFKLEIMSKVEQSESARAFRDLYEEFHALMLESFPDSNPRESLGKMLYYRNKGQDSTKELLGTSSFYYPLLKAYTRDGLDFGIFASNRNDPKLEGMGLQIKNVLIGADKVLTPKLKEKWRSLARKFAE